MVTIALVVFAITALGGALLAHKHFKHQNRPLGLAIVHLLGGATGLVLLLIPVIQGTAPENAKLALGIFLIAALGGFLLLSFRLRKKDLPSPVVLVHAIVAIVAFVILVLAVI